MTKLQELRKNKNLSQNDLAILTNQTKRIIQAYENKQRSIDGASLDKLISLALALNCKISDILEDEELISKCIELGI